MTPREVRMRCIESLSDSGVRDPQRTVQQAKVLEDYVMAAEDKEQGSPTRGRKKAADKEQSPA